MFKKIGFKPDRRQLVKSKKKCVFVMLSRDKIKQCESPLMDIKVVKESFFEIPISPLILRSYWLLGSPCCAATLW